MVAWMRDVKALVINFKLINRAVWLLLLSIIMLSLQGCELNSVGILNPKGIIAYHERKLFFDTLALMLIVVLPVIVMSLAFVYHYQASHRIRDYAPNWSHSYFLESIWWGIPCAIIVILAVITWKKTHELDPYQPIAGATQPPLVIQAIALPWKWLFIYPEQNIATINYLELPVGRPVEFMMTTDNVPMSALFIAQLGSQIYAMAGMRTRLNLMASSTGEFFGQNTQYNGGGFSDMNFPVHAVTPEEMQTWINSVKQSKQALSAAVYQQLLVPSKADKPAYYAGVEPALFDNVIHLYMHSYGPKHPRAGLLTEKKE
jgi:cytochrome o ubiquinol oxidase subunit 2